MNRVVKYAVLRNVQQLTIQMLNLNDKQTRFVEPLVFSCPSLTSLELRKLSSGGPPMELPKSLQLPALESLFLANARFTASDDDGCAKPFLVCNLLNTLVLKECSLH